jgi:octaprenyl-diphosphate synthase
MPRASAPAELALTKRLVAADIERVNALILSFAHSEIPLIPELIRHLVASGGKRLRPSLTLLCAKMLGYHGDRHIALATCVEFIHTATLLHDDVVDESKLRRGKATANDIWGNKISVLVGDFLFSRAFQLMVKDGSLEVLRILSDVSATLAQGEVLQLSTSNELTTSEEDYLQVIQGKTAALFAAACEIGAAMTNHALYQPILRDFGTALGIAFQMVDDALDYVADETALGKTVGDDFREGKVTLPLIHAYQHGTDSEREFWQRVIGEHQQTAEDLSTALELLDKYDSIGYALNQARVTCSHATALLQQLPDTPERAALSEIVDFSIHRAY